jgi:hypothetical protein
MKIETGFLAHPFDVPAALAPARESLAKKIAAFETEWRPLAAPVEAVALLTREIELRQEIDAYLTALTEQLEPAVVGPARQALADVQARVRSAMESAGFTGSIESAVADHPDVKSAAQSLTVLSDFHVEGSRANNQAALAECSDLVMEWQQLNRPSAFRQPNGSAS